MFLDLLFHWKLFVSTLQSSTLFTKIIFSWIVVEILFYLILQFFFIPKLQSLTTPLSFRVEPIQLVIRVLETIDSLHSYSIEKFITGFFCGAKVEDVYLENLHSFLAWAMYAKTYSDLKPTEFQQIQNLCQIVEERYNLKFKAGMNPNVRHVCMTYEGLRHSHLPLLMYFTTEVLQFIFTRVVLKLFGFHPYHLNHISYFYRDGVSPYFFSSKHNNSSSESHSLPPLPPLVIFHGISPGWAAYSSMVHSLCGNDDKRPCFLVNLDAITIKSLTFQMPSPETFSLSIKQMLQRHGFAQHKPNPPSPSSTSSSSSLSHSHLTGKASFIGHSFGSILCAWVATTHPEIVSHITLLDPVSLLLGLPEVAYHFIYRSPTTMIQKLISFFAAQELTIAYNLHRNFWWYRNVLWLEDLPDEIGVVIGVAGGDEVNNPETVYEYVHNFREARQTLIQSKSDRPVNNTYPSSLWASNPSRLTVPLSFSLSGKVSPRQFSPPSRPSPTNNNSDPTNGISSTNNSGKFSTVLSNNPPLETDEKILPSPLPFIKSPSQTIGPVSLLYWPSFSHGQILLSSPRLQELSETLRHSEIQTLYPTHNTE